MILKARIMEEADIARALKRIAHEITERFGGTENVVLYGIKTRGVPIAGIIADNIASIEGIRPALGSLDITLYRDDLSSLSPDPVYRSAENACPVEGKHVILVDDVLFTGRTTRAAMDAITDIGRPASISLAVLIDRGHRELPIKADYVGKNVPTGAREVISVKIKGCDDETCVLIYAPDLNK